jgi:hypothetical protein
VGKIEEAFVVERHGLKIRHLFCDLPSTDAQWRKTGKLEGLSMLFSLA